MKKYIVIFCVIFTCGKIHSNDQLVFTSTGITEGTKRNNVIIWEDIPYAKPPINNLRWRAPVEYEDRKKIISPKVKNYCVQRPSSLGGVDGEGMFVGTEDCLYLDIFAPKNKSTKKLPVMFWIHGGGNTSGLKDTYDFSKFVKRHNVIVVRINYRLGPFGWFYHPSIQNNQKGLDKTANFGTLDIISALTWVQKNISLFNGDNKNVTIFGESAGGHNVLSLLVSDLANGKFHKAISMSGYTTSIPKENLYIQNFPSSTSNYTSSKIVEKILIDKNLNTDIYDLKNLLLNLSTEEFFQYYADRKTYDELPLLANDGIVIPSAGLKLSLSDSRYLKNIPFIAGSNKDEVKLWISTAEYFIDLEWSLVGNILGIPRVVLRDEDAFEAFNYYRSSAWKIRGVDQPLNGFKQNGFNKIYAYRFDWDDHRQFIIGDFKNLIGAAHATEIPLLLKNYDLVGGYPISDLIYPPSFSKRFTSKNMMLFWANFAKTGKPGTSSNGVEWKPYSDENSFLILDRRKDMQMKKGNKTFEGLMNQLFLDKRVNELERCVILLQMLTYVGEDLYDSLLDEYPGSCSREDAEKFIIENASFIEY